MEKIESNGEVIMDFKVTLAYVAELDTTFVKLDGEPMPLMSIFSCITTHCQFYGLLSASHLGQVFKACVY